MGLKDFQEFGDSSGNPAKPRGTGRTIHIYSISHGWNISFFAAFTSFDESYKVNYNKEEVYGRMDPICTYKGTQRTLSFGLEAMAQDFGDGMHLQQKLSYLAANLYPTYDSHPGDKSATSIVSPPYFKIMFGSMITDGGTGFTGGPGTKFRIGYGPYGREENPASEMFNLKGNDVKSEGLTGIIESFQFSPILDIGMWTHTDKVKTSLGSVPKGYTINIDFTAIHNVDPGWVHVGSDNDVPLADGFPYGYSLKSWQTAAKSKFHPADPVSWVGKVEDIEGPPMDVVGRPPDPGGTPGGDPTTPPPDGEAIREEMSGGG
jgi:hypothetical protein